MPKIVTEKEVNSIVVPALRDWVKESGILKSLKERGIRNYAFLLIGGAGYGYAKRKKSDTDIMLVYDPFEQRGSLDDYKRLHARIHGYVKEKAKNLDKELDEKREKRLIQEGSAAVREKEREEARADDELEKERARLISSLEKASETIGLTSLSDSLCSSIGISKRATSILEYKKGEGGIALANANERLAETGLHFGQLFLRPLWMKKDTVMRIREAGTIPAYTEGLETGYVWLLPETLFILKKGRLVLSSEKAMLDKFILFITLLIKMSFLCGFTKRYTRFNSIRSEIKRLVRTEDPANIEQARVLAEEIKSWGKIPYVYDVELDRLIAKETFL